MFFAVAQLLNYKNFWLNDLGEANQFLRSLKSSLTGEVLAIPEKTEELFYLMKARQTGRTEPFRDLKRRLHPGGWKGNRGMNHPAPLLSAFLTWSGAGYTQGGYRHKGGISRQGFENYVRLAHEVMRRTQPHITRLDYRKVLAACHKDDVVYIDVPYKGANVKTYNDKTIDFPSLIQTLLDAPYKWLYSEYDHPIYKPLTEKFGPPVKFRVQRTMANSNYRGRKWVWECVWKNF